MVKLAMIGVCGSNCFGGLAISLNLGRNISEPLFPVVILKLDPSLFRGISIRIPVSKHYIRMRSVYYRVRFFVFWRSPLFSFCAHMSQIRRFNFEINSIFLAPFKYVPGQLLL